VDVAGTAARAAVVPRFPGLGRGYESFYVRAVDPVRPRAVWLRHTVHKAAGEPAVGSVWVTLFDRDAPAPVAHKLSLPGPAPEPGGWIRIGDSAFGPGGVAGTAGPARYDLRFSGDEPPLRHLPAEWLYRAPIPRTKLESPLPAVTVSGSVAVGDTAFELDGWAGMVGHNWGDQHAERWIWLHGVAFEDAPDAWLDLSAGRVRLGPVTTPWIVNGVVSAGGRRTRFGGPAAARRTTVREDPLRLDLHVPGEGGAWLELTASSPRDQTVVWRYADPDHSEHHTANCSVAALEAVLHPRGGVPLRLATAHGGAYELGMRETAHGLPVQPFPDP
jgi:hypothetical protein